MSGETTIKVVFITRLRFKVKLLDHCNEKTQGAISCWSGVLRRNWGLSLTVSFVRWRKGEYHWCSVESTKDVLCREYTFLYFVFFETGKLERMPFTICQGPCSCLQISSCTKLILQWWRKLSRTSKLHILETVMFPPQSDIFHFCLGFIFCRFVFWSNWLIN